MAADLNALQNESNLLLEAPNVIPQIDTQNVLALYIWAKNGDYVLVTGDCILTDDIYSFTIPNLVWGGAGFPLLNTLYMDIPADWNVLSTKLKIHFDYIEGATLTIEILKVVIQSAGPTITRPQYLPIMGVG